MYGQGHRQKNQFRNTNLVISNLGDLLTGEKIGIRCIVFECQIPKNISKLEVSF